METSIDSLLIVGIIPGGGCYCVGCSSKVWFSSLHLVGAADGTPTSSTFGKFNVTQKLDLGWCKYLGPCKMRP